MTQTTKAQRHRGDEGHRKTGGVPGLGGASAGSGRKCGEWPQARGVEAGAGSGRARGRVQRQATDTLVMEATTRARSASEACSDS